jgi:hypothetical protein
MINKRSSEIASVTGRHVRPHIFLPGAEMSFREENKKCIFHDAQGNEALLRPVKDE